MKLRLSILLLAAAALAAAPAAGQTIKSLGYNTTNGQVVYSGSNSLTFTNALQFSTNARADTRTNLGGTTVGNAVFTATNAAAARSAIGAGTGDGNVSNGGEPDFETVTVQDFITALSIKDTSSDVVKINLENPSLNHDATNSILEWSATEVQLNKPLTFFGTNTASTTRTNLGLGATNAVTFSNITASGSLTATGNATLNGSDNLMPNATTASSASSLMTRQLSDDRYRIFYVPLVHVLSQTAANGSTWNLRPFHSADAVFSVPPWARNVRVYLSTGFTNAPVSNNFTAVISAYQLTTSNSFGIPWGTITNAFSATSVWSNGSNSHRFIFGMTNDLALPSGGIADAESANFWNILIQLRNDSSASLTTVPDNWLRGMAVFTD